MSWSVSALGKPAAVKGVLAKAFESAKQSTANYEHERLSVEAAETLVNRELDHAVTEGVKAVTVSASGSAHKASGSWPGSNQVRIIVEPIFGFIDEV
jgi:hypothetical protein